MKFFVTLSTVAPFLITIIQATPVPDTLPDGWLPISNDVIEARRAGNHEYKRTPGGVYLCTGINWEGQCGYKVQPLDQCIVLTAPWLNNVGSFGPDPGATCFLDIQQECREASAEISYPGTANLYTYANGVFTDSIGAFMCE